ncbi:hypothetical protein A0257_13800 [Hymenobacter psoromatis]|nr:hypothetical protein A0257_13800 [Hymenobacter psoromatis]
MSHQQIIDETSQLLAELPEEQAAEVLDFAAFLRQRQQARVTADEALLMQQIQQQIETSEAFAFLHDEAEDIYSLADVKFHYAAPPDDAAE